MAFYRTKNAATDGEIDSAGRGKPQPKDSYSKTPNKPPPPGGGKVWDYTNEQWVDMPNLDPRRPWSRTGTDGTRTGDPNERLWHEPGSASGNWSPTYYHWDENGNWVPKPDGKYGMPENDDGTPIFTPDPVKYPEYFTGSSYTPTQEQQDLWAAREADRQRRLQADPEWVRAKAAGDRKGMSRAELRLKNRYAEEAFVAQGGTAETWRNRFNTSWPVPKSPLGTSTHNPNGGGSGLNSASSLGGGTAGPAQVPASILPTPIPPMHENWAEMALGRGSTSGGSGNWGKVGTGQSEVRPRQGSDNFPENNPSPKGPDPNKLAPVDARRMAMNQKTSSEDMSLKLQQGGDVMARLMKKWGYT